MDSKTSFLGFVMSPLFWIGSLLIWILSRSVNNSLSPAQKSQKINDLFRDAGYGPNQASYWAAVSKFETGNFTSNLSTKYNNYFGMKVPVSWTGKVVDLGGSTWINPSSLEDSVSAQIAYLKRNAYPAEFQSLPQFVTFMKSKGYFTEPYQDYYNGVAAWLN